MPTVTPWSTHVLCCSDCHMSADLQVGQNADCSSTILLYKGSPGMGGF